MAAYFFPLATWQNTCVHGCAMFAVLAWAMHKLTGYGGCCVATHSLLWAVPADCLCLIAQVSFRGAALCK